MKNYVDCSQVLNSSKNIYEYLCEASEINCFRNGWPKSVATNIGNGFDFIRTSKKMNEEGEILYVRYVQAAGCVSLIVFND